MRRNCFLFHLVLVALCAAVPVATLAQTAELRVTKSGSDAVLTIVSGGAAPYDYYKALSPTLSVGVTVLSSADPSSTYTESGGLTNGMTLVFYQIGDANKPAIAITSPAPGSSVSTPKVLVTGTQTNAVNVWVNNIAASLSAGAFTSSAASTPNVPLVEGLNTVTASAVDASGNVAVTTEDLTKLGNNPNAPAIATLTITPSEGTDPYVVYTPRPAVTVNYSDADGIDTTKVFVYLNGDSLTPTVIDGAHATFTLLNDLQPGTNFISVSVADDAGAAFRVSTKTARLAVRGPLVASISPTTGSKVGDTITIAGHGFSTTASDNVVTFPDGVTALANASPTESSFQVTIPAGAQTGPVKVTVNSHDSNNDQQLKVILVSGRQSIGGLAWDHEAILSGTDLPILFTDRGTSDSLFQCQSDGTAANLGYLFNEPTGLARDAAGNLFTGQANTGGPGFIDRFTPGSPIAAYGGTTKISPEASSQIVGLGCTDQWQPSGSTLNLYLLDSANSGKIKKMAPDLTVSYFNTQADTYPSPNALAVRSGQDFLYFSTSNDIKKIEVATATRTNVKTAFYGPRAMTITWDNKLIVPRMGSFNRQVSVVDPDNPTGCAGACISYDLTPAVSTGNFPLLVACNRGRIPGHIVVADGATNAAATQIYRLPKPYLLLTQADGTLFPEGTKIYADYDPTQAMPAAETPDSQFVILRVRTSPGPGTLPTGDNGRLFPNGAAGDYPAVVEWHFEDVLDPTRNDPNPAPPDNGTNWDGWQANPWGQEGSYTLNTVTANPQTAVINGESRVRFHYTDKPGDNYIIKVRAKIPGYDKFPLNPPWDSPENCWIQAETPILTVWKRLHVEVDSFGAAAPLNPQAHADDAAFNDLPDPASDGVCDPLALGNPCLDPLRNILAPAFVEPFYDAGNSKGDIFFNAQTDYALKVVNGTGPDDRDLINERNYNAGSVSNTGSWGVYLLGAYEVADGKYLDGLDYFGYSDNDPEPDPIPGTTDTGYPAGMTASNCGSTLASTSVTFDEEIRDLCAQNGFNFWYFLNSTAWHEIGHQLHLLHAGTTDGTGGLMEPLGPQKNLCLPRTYLETIRAILYPSCLY
jgi:hypothetical protein